MSTCRQNPTIRVEKILENKRKNVPMYDTSEMVMAVSPVDQINAAGQPNIVNQPNQMNGVNPLDPISNIELVNTIDDINVPDLPSNPNLVNSLNDINPAATLPVEEMTDVLEDINITPPPTNTQAIPAPGIIPNAPTFRVPSNPLLPEEYQEILNYNDLQYANGFFRTQIGRFVRIESLVGSDNIVTYHGFLVGVGLNYVLLQEGGSRNIQSIDFWGIKSMYIYYDTSDIRRIISRMPAELS